MVNYKICLIFVLGFLTACGSDVIVNPYTGEAVKPKVDHVEHKFLDINVDQYARGQVTALETVDAFAQLHKSRLSDVRAFGLEAKMVKDEEDLHAGLIKLLTSYDLKLSAVEIKKIEKEILRKEAARRR